MATQCCLKLLIALFNQGIFFFFFQIAYIFDFLKVFDYFQIVFKAAGISEHKYLNNCLELVGFLFNPAMPVAHCDILGKYLISQKKRGRGIGTPCLSVFKSQLNITPHNMLQLLISPEVIRQLDLIFVGPFQLNYSKFEFFICLLVVSDTIYFIDVTVINCCWRRKILKKKNC